MQCRVFAASAIGKSHIDGGIPCQDAFAFHCMEDVLLAAVCDGAGSAALSHVGANTVASTLVAALAARYQSGEHLHLLDADAFKQEIEAMVSDARANLETLAKNENTALADYSATLVGVVTSGKQGYFFHIGDGLAIAQSAAPETGSIISLPENGEYANETYFITGAEWSTHLRITPITKPIEMLALMSDGAMPFVMSKGNSDFFRPFIDPVAGYLKTVSSTDGSKALAGTLSDVRTHQITSDDKALLISLWR